MNIMTKYWLISWVFLLFFLKKGYSQNDALNGKTFTVKALKEDFRALRKHIETKNPLAYVYHSRATIQKRLDSIEALIDTPMTELEFYRLISLVAPITKDGHNLILPTVSLIKKIGASPYNLPIKIRLIEDKFVLIRNLSNNSTLKTGQIITTINGISSDAMIEYFLKRLPQEGNQIVYPKHIISQWFDFFYHLHYGFDKKYTIEYIENDLVKKVTIQGENSDSIYLRRTRRYPESISNKGIVLKILNDSTQVALLSIPTFSSSVLKNRYHQKHFKKQIKQCFKVIFQKDIQHLIIDVRSNSGGNPAYTSYVLQFLFDKPFVQAREARVVRQVNQDELLERTTPKWFPWYGVGTFKPKSQNYKNNLYVLMNGGTFSSAVEFVSTLSKYNRATFLGSESGGNPIIMSGNYLKESRKLPNTKITHYSGYICTIYNDLSLNTGRGLLPDYEVQPTIEGTINGIDKCLEKALEVILNDE